MLVLNLWRNYGPIEHLAQSGFRASLPVARIAGSIPALFLGGRIARGATGWAARAAAATASDRTHPAGPKKRLAGQLAEPDDRNASKSACKPPRSASRTTAVEEGEPSLCRRLNAPPLFQGNPKDLSLGRACKGRFGNSRFFRVTAGRGAVTTRAPSAWDQS